MSEDLQLIKDYPSRNEWEAACWRKISKSQDLLDLIVTPHERRDLVIRAAAVQAILSGKSYRQIGKELWLSSQTISSIKKALRSKKYLSYYERGRKEPKKRTGSIVLPRGKKTRGRPVRTKFGTMYMS